LFTKDGIMGQVQTGRITRGERVGIVGVGRMGSNMAHRLRDCGYALAALYDVNSERAQRLAEALSTTATDSLAAVTRQSDVIITVVTDDAAMREIYGRHADHLLMGSAGKLFINCATVSPSVHVELARQAAEADARMLEVPMASSIVQAREGTLFLMCAGDETVFHEARPLLDALAAEIVYTGGPGTAASLKALVNMVMNINTAALAEGLGLADALGLDLDRVRQVFSRTGAASRVLETDGEDMQNREHDTYFSAAHATKDCRIALELGQACHLPMILAEATTRQYEELVRQGLGELDKSGIAELTFKNRRKEHTLSL
jgi:3-hydroxyisobutyrate dehydrogenase-like beta-hydroxyacid dehydrogenase